MNEDKNIFSKLKYTYVILISNDYKTSPKPLIGVDKDVEHIFKIFPSTNIVHIHNTPHDELINRIDKIDFKLKINLDNKSESIYYKSCLMVYSGHGYEDTDKFPGIHTIDNKKITFKTIINQINSKPNKPNLYIIDDACRTTSTRATTDPNIYTYDKNLLMIHAIDHGEKAKCTIEGGFLITSIPLGLTIKDNIDDLVTFMLINYNLKHPSFSPKIYANSAFRKNKSELLDILVSITKQSQESVIATKIRSKYDINEETRAEIKKQCHILGEDITNKSLKEMSEFVTEKIDKYEKIIKYQNIITQGQDTFKYCKDNFYKIIQTAASFNVDDNSKIDTAENRLKILQDTIDNYKKGHIKLTADEVNTYNDKIKKYTEIIKQKNILKSDMDKMNDKVSKTIQKLNNLEIDKNKIQNAKIRLSELYNCKIIIIKAMMDVV